MSRRQGFWSVAFAFTAVMAYSAVPAPLYVIYGFSSITTTIVFAAYAVGVVAGLFLAGHVSDWYGRRRVLVPALALSLFSGLFFLAFRDPGWLIVGRVLNGLSVGACTATATAWLQELEGGRRSEVVATAANLGGLGLGPLLAGVLAQWAGAPLVLPYAVALTALALGTLLALGAPETRERTPHRYRPQHVTVPHGERARFYAACAGAGISFAGFGLFTSLAPKFLGGTLHHPSRALAGAAACAVFGSAVAAQLATAGRSPRALAAGGIALVPLGLALIVLAVWLPTPSLDLFLLGGVVSGVGGGLLFKGGVGTVAAIAEPEHRAEALAGLFLAGYTGLAVPVIGLGILTQELSARASLLIFAALLAGGVLVAARPLLAQPVTRR